MLGNLSWGTMDNRPPLDTPVCGFFKEKCPKDTSGRKFNMFEIVLHILSSFSLFYTFTAETNVKTVNKITLQIIIFRSESHDSRVGWRIGRSVCGRNHSWTESKVCTGYSRMNQLIAQYFIMIYHFIARKKRLEQELQQMLWRVNYDDIRHPQKRTASVVSNT